MEKERIAHCLNTIECEIWLSKDGLLEDALPLRRFKWAVDHGWICDEAAART